MSENRSLYDITAELQSIAILAQEEEFTPEMETALVIAQTQFAAKAGGFAHIINRLKAEAAFAESEIARIKAYLERKEKAVDRLKKSLLDAVLNFGREQRNGVRFIESDMFRISTRRAPAVVTYDVEQIPSEYYNSTVTIKGMSKPDADRFVQLVNNSKIVCAGTADNFQVTSASAKSEISATRIKEANQAGINVPGAKYDTERYGLAIK
jgi:hypothetical protein